MITPNHNRLIDAIAARAVTLYQRHDVKAKAEYIAAELRIVHEEIASLRLQELLDADDGNFAHDISGIHQHLVIGKPSTFKDGFYPRFAI
jgi:hypothetical protein